MTIKVEGMTCANCALGIKRTQERSGFASVDVDFTSGSVSYDEEKSPESGTAVRLIQSLGYHVPASDAMRRKPFLSDLRNRFIISAILTFPLLLHMVIKWAPLHDPWVQLAMALPVYVMGMAFFGKGAMNSLRSGVANMDVLVTLGASAAFFYSLYGTLASMGPAFQFYESAATILTVIMLGNLLEQRAVKQTGAVIDELEGLKGEMAKKVVQTTTGAELIEEVPVADLIAGDIIQVNQGDPVPADGILTDGEGSADESMISGEGIPVEKSQGSSLVAGSLVLSGSMRVRVTETGGKTVLAGIIDLVRSAQKNKPKLQNLADRISAWFVPVVIVISILTFIISYLVIDLDVTQSALRAIAVLVIACPCALGLAIPTAVVVGIGLAARRGILVKRADIFDSISGTRTIVFDKTGTLTTGEFRLGRIRVSGIGEEEVLKIIFNLEKHSSHPLARSLVNACGNQEVMEFDEVREHAGIGMQGRTPRGIVFMLGSNGDSDADLVLHRDGVPIAFIHLEDMLREDAGETINDIREMGIETIMLSGDRMQKASTTAQQLGITKYYAGKKPDEKLRLVESMSREGITLMVGDGINDAPVLQQADVGISFSSASGAAQNAAQVVLVNDRLQNLPELLRISRLTQLTIRQNLFWVFFYNALAIPFAAMGYLSPMIAAILMALSDVIVVGNSLRLRWRYGRRPGRLT